MTVSRTNDPSAPVEEQTGAPALRFLVLGSGGLFVLLLAAAVLLWVKNGTSVFFETLSSGIAGCF